MDPSLHIPEQLSRIRSEGGRPRSAPLSKGSSPLRPHRSVSFGSSLTSLHESSNGLQDRQNYPKTRTRIQSAAVSVATTASVDPDSDSDPRDSDVWDISDRDYMETFNLKSPSLSSRSSRLSSARGRRSTLDYSGPFTDLVVNQYSIDNDIEKRVMYHIDVVGSESQLETYTIRRSYTDFKVLHEQLRDVLETRKAYYESLHEAKSKAKELQSRPAAGSKSTGRYSVPSASRDSGESVSDPSSPDSLLETEIASFELPPLPPAGLMSFWKRHDRAHLEQRCEAFQDLLHAVMHLPILRDSYAMQRFLSVAPATIRERGSSYVSLREYSVPHLDPDEELHERRRRAIEHRRASSSSFIVTE